MVLKNRKDMRKNIHPWIIHFFRWSYTVQNQLSEIYRDISLYWDVAKVAFASQVPKICLVFSMVNSCFASFRLFFFFKLPRGSGLSGVARSSVMTSKSIGFSGRCCFNFCPCFWFYCQTDFGSRFPPTPSEANTIRTKCFTLPGVKILLFWRSFFFFYKSMHPWKLDISYFILVCGCHCKWTLVHMQPPQPLPLISLTTTNCRE